MRAALRLAHDQLAPQELDRLAGAEDADFDQASVLRPSPAPRSGRIRCHVSRLRRAPRGVNVPNQRLHLRAILAGRQGCDEWSDVGSARPTLSRPCSASAAPRSATIPGAAPRAFGCPPPPPTPGPTLLTRPTVTWTPSRHSCPA